MNANQTLKQLLRDVLYSGTDVPSRVGSTKELTFVNFTVGNPQDRYITLPGRKVSVPAQIAETMWVLAGRNDTDWLSAYLPQAPTFADDGKHWRAGYGPRLRGWRASGIDDGVDQLTNVIELLKKDPTTRRAVISIWDPTTDVGDSKDIPCNNWLHFLCRDGKLNLNVAIRSNDLMWGWSGINFFEWSVLLEIVANHAGLEVGQLHFNVSSLHLYERHFEKAKRIVEAPLEASAAHGKIITYDGRAGLDNLVAKFFEIEQDIRNGDLKTIETMPDPLFWSWLWAIAYYWGHEETAAMMLEGSDIINALKLSPKRKQPVDVGPLIQRMQLLHTEKSLAYGDSWKKRGELFSIIPNIARKVDRILAKTETSDETKLDTAMDLVVYLAKYSCWVEDVDALIPPTTEEENLRIDSLVRMYAETPQKAVTEQRFDDLLHAVESRDIREPALGYLIEQAVGYLVKLWSGPEGRALRNEKRSWNPDPSVPQLQVSYQNGGVLPETFNDSPMRNHD